MDTNLLTLTRDAVKHLIHVADITKNHTKSKQCQDIAETIGTTLAPQLYGSRIHGSGNAISVVIRCCAEALFWLEFDNSDMIAEAKEAIISLRDFLQNPNATKTL